MFYLLIGCDLLTIGISIWKFSTLPPNLPLFYSRPWGEDQLVDWWMIFLLPLIMNGFFFLNFFIYKKFFKENLFIRKILDYFNIFLIISLTLVFIKIIFLVS